MKILQILPSLEVGGVERGVVDLVRAMKRRGEGVAVVSSGGELVKELEKIGVPHYTLPVHRKSLFSLSVVSQIAEIIRREGIDLVHARSRVPAWLAWLAARQAGVPFVTTCHGYYSLHWMSCVMGWGKRVIVTSQVMGRHMMDHFGVPGDRIRLIHRGVDLSQFRFSPKGARDPKQPFRIMNMGRLSPIKGQAEFLRAVHLFRRQVPKVEVWLVGSEEKGRHRYTRKLRQMIDQLGLAPCVKWLGTRRDIPQLLAQVDVLVLSTLVPEAFGRVVVEAGAVGTPVIATRLGGVLDIIDHGQNGLLAEPGDIQEMARALHEMYENEKQAKGFAQNLRQKVETQFALESMVEKTLEVYGEVLREKKILVIKLGAAGDVILATPSFRMLRERFPKSHLAVMVDKKLAPLIANCPYLNDLVLVDRTRLSSLSYLLKLAKRIRKEGFDCSVDLQNSKWTHGVAALAGIRERHGFARGPFGFLLNRPDHTTGVKEAPVKNQFRILSKLGIRKLEEDLELWPDSDSEKRVQEMLEREDRNGSVKRVGLSIGASSKWLTKRWPLPLFRELAERLTRELHCEVALIGSSDDAPSVEEVFGAEPNGKMVLSFVGKTSLGELISLVKRMDVLVTGDTAPLHIASAVNTRVVALFGPTDPLRHMPPSVSPVVLRRSLPCQPCYQGICHNPDLLACLKNISVEEVFEAVKRQLNVGAGFPRPPKGEETSPLPVHPK